jgi:hypothetical protein
MARWGLCWGCLLGLLAVTAAGTAMWWLDGTAYWVGWGAFAALAWGAVMSVYSFDRPARAGARRE